MSRLILLVLACLLAFAALAAAPAHAQLARSFVSAEIGNDAVARNPTNEGPQSPLGFK
jgi:hypothetical protein